VQDATAGRTFLSGGSSGARWVSGLLPSPGLPLHAMSKSTPIVGSNLRALLFASYQLPEETSSLPESVQT